MKTMINKEIIFGYFAGTCSPLQKKLIAAWVKDEKNAELFYLWLWEWERKNVQYEFDVDQGIRRHQAWLEALENEEEPPAAQSTVTRLVWIRKTLAAGVVLLTLAAVGIATKDALRYRHYQTTYGKIEKITLPDGSQVTLNANSTLNVPRFGFGEKFREVFLRGEASFDVVHTRNGTRFFVRTEHAMDIEVLGTAFNVYTRPSGVKVVLQRGAVRLNYTRGNRLEQIKMKPGELASLGADGNVKVRFTRQAEQYSDWKYHRFVFEDLTFREIAGKLEEVFGTKIIIKDPELAGQLISGSFRALDAEELITLLREAQDFNYTKTEQELIITQP